MGSFGIWHTVIVLVVLSLPVGIGLILWLILRTASKRSGASGAGAWVASSGTPSAEARLEELAGLWSKGLITNAEYEQQRTVVIRSI